jgi:Na+-translocating ferredoxin:NAD+ oxidoreductase subunit B
LNAPVSAEAVEDLLPQTQCRKCGYAGCRPYAVAIAAGTADINRCPPGGDEGVAALAALVRLVPRPLDPACGSAGPPLVAVIDEAQCIGCTLCIRACPVDAIVGAAKLMHTVIRDECTGCELCLPPCPVDCIDLVPVPGPPAADGERRRAAAQRARRRYEARMRRLERRKSGRSALGRPTTEERKQETIARAIERARARLAARSAR